MLKLLIHAPTEAALQRALANARNLLLAEPQAQVEIVVNGAAALPALAIDDATLRARMVVCANSLARAGVAPPNDVAVVPAAVLHVAQQQAQGWAYWRA
jgi:intracellular sulfur oxidation DsrE/DsrF family protein